MLKTATLVKVGRAATQGAETLFEATKSASAKRTTSLLQEWTTHFDLHLTDQIASGVTNDRAGTRGRGGPPRTKIRMTMTVTLKDEVVQQLMGGTTWSKAATDGIEEATDRWFDKAKEQSKGRKDDFLDGVERMSMAVTRNASGPSIQWRIVYTASNAKR